MAVLVIAEAGSNWLCDFEVLKRMADAAKACGADVLKLQWTSDGIAMAKRRGLDPDKSEKGFKAASMYCKWLAYHPDHLPKAKKIIEAAGLEFMCTVYLPQDIAVIAPLVKRFKVSAFEYSWEEFQGAHDGFRKPVIVSVNPGAGNHRVIYREAAYYLHCVSKYPCPLEEMEIDNVRTKDGLSDHSTSLIAGALAVSLHAEIIEKHVRLTDTPDSCPDYGHSLVADGRHVYLSDIGKGPPIVHHSEFGQYVAYIREAERML